MGRIRDGVGSGSNSSPWIEIQAEASRIWTYRIEQHIRIIIGNMLMVTVSLGTKEEL